MNDAIALLAISQLVCLGAIFYLYTQLQGLRDKARGRRTTISPRAHPMPSSVDMPQRSAARRAREAYAPVATSTRVPASREGAASLAARLAETGVDVAALARRMQKSEEEVRLLLRRQGVLR